MYQVWKRCYHFNHSLASKKLNFNSNDSMGFSVSFILLLVGFAAYEIMRTLVASWRLPGKANLLDKLHYL